MDSDATPESNVTPAPDAPMAPPSPPTEMAAPFVPESPAAPYVPAPPAAPAYAPTEQVPQYAPTAQYAPAAAAPQPSSVVLAQSAPPAKRKPWLAVVAGVAILGLGAAAVVGWMGKASAEDDVKAGEEVAARLNAEADDLRDQVDTANQATADVSAELDAAEGQVTELEDQVGSLEGEVSELQATVAAKEAEIATLEENQNNNNNSGGTPGLNDLVLTPQEYGIIESATGITPPPIEIARVIGAEVCAAETIAEVLDVVQAHINDFPGDTTAQERATVAGGIAGLMCQDHILELAG